MVLIEDAMTLDESIRDIVTSPLDYTKEVKAFAKRYANGEVNGLPLVNQSRSLTNCLRALSTDYPYLAILGNPGIGKSMMMDLILRGITGEMDEKELELFSAEDRVLIDQIRSKLDNYESKSYISLPNMRDPMRVKPLSYSDRDVLKSDLNIAQGFSDSLIAYLNDFPKRNRNQFKFTLEEDEFMKYATGLVRNAYIDRLEEFSKQIHSDITSNRRKPIPTVRMKSIKKDRESPKFADDIEGELNFSELDVGGRAPAYGKLKGLSGVGHGKKASHDTVRKLIGENFFGGEFASTLEDVLNKLDKVQVEGLDIGSKAKLIRDELESFSDKAASFTEFEHPEGLDLFELGSKLRNNYAPGSLIKLSMSDGLLDDIVGAVSKIGEEYLNKKPSEELQTWITSVVDYFSENRGILDTSIQSMALAVERAEEEHSFQLAQLLKLTAKGARPSADKEEQLSTLEDKIYGEITFQLPHGRLEEVPVSQIFSPNPLYGVRASEVSVTSSKLSSFNDDDLVGSIENADKNPPHKMLSVLGDLFAGGILEVRDDLGSLIQYIADANRGAEAKGVMSMESVLEWLQSGNLRFTSSGVQYEFYLPKMIIGSGNEYPFYTEGEFDYRFQPGLEDRFTSVWVDEATTNTQETREGTLKVLYKALDDFSEEKGVTMGIDTQAANLFLKGSTFGKTYLGLDYRSFVQNIERFASVALSRGEETITLQTIKDTVLEELGPTHLNRIDEDYFSGRGYLTYDEATPGIGSVLYFADGGQGGTSRLKSSFIPKAWELGPEESPFVYVDGNPETPDLLDDTAKKAYQRASEFIGSLIKTGYNGKGGLEKELLNSRNWQISTEKPENWGGMGGPSSSALLSVSMLSAMSGRAMYKNRFMTGTMDSTGKVGVIGGVHAKASVPARISELEKERLGKDSTGAYLIFPEGNLFDYKTAIEVDPLDLDSKIKMAIPVGDFAAAYYLATAPENEMKRENIKRASELGGQYIVEDLKRFGERIKALNE